MNLSFNRAIKNCNERAAIKNIIIIYILNTINWRKTKCLLKKGAKEAKLYKIRLDWKNNKAKIKLKSN